MTTAYVLTDPQGQISDRDQLDLYDGYLALAYHTKLVTSSEIYSNLAKITKDDIFGGHVQLCQFIWKQLKIEDPAILDYPPEFQEFLGRRIRQMDLRSFKKILQENEDFGKTYFVKPVLNKLFTGFTCVTEQDISKLICSMNTKVYVSSSVNFGAEFRAYVYKGKIVDCFRYWGADWTVNTPVDDIKKMVALSKVPAIFYSIDVGIDTTTGKTLLIEVNDGYALGNYGLAPVDYAKYSADRWIEICNKGTT